LKVIKWTGGWTRTNIIPMSWSSSIIGATTLKGIQCRSCIT